MRISIYGRCVVLPHAVDLPLERAAEGTPPVLRVEIGELEAPTHRYLLDDMVALSVAPGVVAVSPQVELGPRAIEHYLVDHAVPTGLSCDGDLVVHAACLERDGQAVVFLGRSGAGKSTLSLQLIEAGWRLLGDDSVRLDCVDDGVRAWSSYPGLRLNEDVLTGRESEANSVVAEYGTKRRWFAAAADAASSAAVGLLVELGENGPLNVTELGPARRAAAIASQLFLPPTVKADGMNRLESVAPVAAALAGVRVDYPRTTIGGRAVCDLLDDWIADRSVGGHSWPDSR